MCDHTQRRIHLHLVLFFIHDVSVTLEELVKDVIVFLRYSVVLVRAVDRVLLHLSEGVALEDVAKELIVSFLKALKIVHRMLILSFDDLHFAQGQRRIETVLNVVQLEHFSVDLLNVQVFNEVCQVVFAESKRRRGHHTVVQICL